MLCKNVLHPKQRIFLHKNHIFQLKNTRGLTTYHQNTPSLSEAKSNDPNDENNYIGKVTTNQTILNRYLEKICNQNVSTGLRDHFLNPPKNLLNINKCSVHSLTSPKISQNYSKRGNQQVRSGSTEVERDRNTGDGKNRPDEPGIVLEEEIVKCTPAEGIAQNKLRNSNGLETIYNQTTPIFTKTKSNDPNGKANVVDKLKKFLESIVNENRRRLPKSELGDDFLNPPKTLLQINKCAMHSLTSSISQNDSKTGDQLVRCSSTDVERGTITGDVEKNHPDEGGIVLEDEIVKYTPPVSLAQSQDKEIYYGDSEQIQQTLKLFRTPKNILHNIFATVAKETKRPSLKLSASYKSIKDKKISSWICTYHLRWPEDMKFLAKDTKKSMAAHKAAVAALAWLRAEKKITDQGMPKLLDKGEVKKLQKSFPILKLDSSTIESMKEIVDLHKNEIAPHIVVKDKLGLDQNHNYVEEDKEEAVTKEPGSVNWKSVTKQRYISLNQYLAKEKVKLPIADYKDDFINLLKANQVVIVKGEPGCGKSTRVPQYVLEAWAKEDGSLGEMGRVAVTQPRRIAAISLAERVSSERDESIGSIVGYQVRLKSNYRPTTGRILYCTTGILLRHLQSDANLTTFSHVILDEAHERDVNTDLLMNLLRNALKTNPKLKLVVMSATIDTNMFSEFYGGAPVMEIPGFTYPVKERFLDSCASIDVAKTLKMCESNVPMVVHQDVVSVIKGIHRKKKEGAILVFLPGWEDISKIRDRIPSTGDMVVYCLHSRLQDSEQWKIFSKPPPGIRKVILATNIAETSVTIDDVVYVIDTGIHKEQRFDIEKGINIIDNHWISKASATQRKGRAGRTQPGECYRMYPRSKYEAMQDYSLPEILRTSLTKIVLDSKVYSNNMDALAFMGQLPTPPEEGATLRAVEELKELELLDEQEKLTTLGKTVAEFQLEPKLSKAMVNSVIFKCVTPIVDIVTLFSAETELFVTGMLDKEGVKNVKKRFCADSDHLAVMRVFEKWLEYSEEGGGRQLENFCREANLVPHKMETINKLRKIHFDYLFNGLLDVLPISDSYSDNDELVKAVLFSGVGTVLQHRNWDIVRDRLKNNVNVLLTRNNQKATVTSESVNFKRQKYPSQFLVYINETRSNLRRTTLVRECSLIPELSVLLFSNKKLDVKNIEKEEFSPKIQSEDQVKIIIENTKIQVICDRKQAQDLMDCKDAIMAGYRYYIRQITELGEHNKEVNSSWDRILVLISEILTKNRI